MNRSRSAVVAGYIGFALLVLTAGCRPEKPPPPRVAVPSRPTVEANPEPARPLPQQPPPVDDLAPPFDDVPIVNQRPPEQPAFVDAYHRVGSPRITLFVNRTLTGRLVPTNADENDGRDFPPPGQFDELQARALDYEAVEKIMTDWISSNGQVTVISPTLAQQRLTDQQVRDLQEGRPRVLAEIAEQLGADVLIQVQARPTRQSREGLEVRIIAEAMNTRGGGVSIGRAVVEVPPPLEKTQINRFTRFLARKLMSDMTDTWNAAPPRADAAPPAARLPAPTAAPVPHAPPEVAPSAPPQAAPSATSPATRP